MPILKFYCKFCIVCWCGHWVHSRRMSLRSLMECLGTHCPKLTRLCCQPGKPDWSQCNLNSFAAPSCIPCVSACFWIWSQNLYDYGLNGILDSDPEESLKTKSCSHLIKGCPELSHLALRGYGVADRRANMLLKVPVWQQFPGCLCIVKSLLFFDSREEN